MSIAGVRPADRDTASPVRPHAIAKLPPVRSAGLAPQRGTVIGTRRRLLRWADTSTRTGESPVALSVVGIVPAEIAGVLVLILILILVG
jgi:hypothetical protein